MMWNLTGLVGIFEMMENRGKIMTKGVIAGVGRARKTILLNF